MKKHNLVSAMVNLPRSAKKLIQVIFDLASLAIIYILSVRLTLGGLNDQNILLLGLSFVVVSVLGLKFLGAYRTLTRYAGVRLFELVTLAQFVSTCVVFLLIGVFDVQSSLIFPLLLFLLSVFVISGARLAVREFIYHSRSGGKRLLIYGAGNAGMQLLTLIRQDTNYDVIGFVDDKELLQGSQVHGLKVFPSSSISQIVIGKKITTIALAMPKASREELRVILDRLEPLSISVKTVPVISDLLDSQGYFEELEEVRVEELLGRDRVSPDQDLLNFHISKKVVLVTGAGGSIGSELCRQILMLSPKKLILVDQSELALYNLEQELHEDWGNLILPVMGSVTDSPLMKDILVNEKVDTVYHAAAYKHVPLVETNPFAAIYNNVFGTAAMLEASVSAGVASFTLVSTDKAVRPTNVMGASKRLAEIACQLASVRHGKKTKIAMVRFGNVIGSSGSAIPKFREQIKNGGPVTVTHPEITRYFMVMSEAAELVLQASALAKGGEVFILDMGSPIKIADLVKKLIRFSGLALHDAEKPELGGISIEYTGLRPGEKLYEELLISGNYQDTLHPKIKKITELHPSDIVFRDFMDELRVVSGNRDESTLRALLSNQHIGYKSTQNIVGNVDKTSEQSKTFDTPELSESLVVNSDKAPSLGYVYKKGKSSEKIKASQLSFSKKIFFYLLHKYFLLVRPLTVGARCVVVNDQREVLLVKHTYIEGWHLPGGGIDAGESAEYGVRRELIEEAMLQILGPLKLVGIYHYQPFSNRDHVVVFLSREFKKIRGDSSFEIAECRFFLADNLPADTDKDTIKWISDALVSSEQAFPVL